MSEARGSRNVRSSKNAPSEMAQNTFISAPNT